MSVIAKPFWLPGQAITAHAVEAIPAGRLIAIAETRVDEGYGPCNPAVKLATSDTDPIIGVSYGSAEKGGKVTFHTCGVLEVEAGAALTAGDYVTAGKDGRAAKATARAGAFGITYDDAAAPTGDTVAAIAVQVL